NAEREKPFPGEEDIIFPSDRDVATYDLAPEMKAREIGDAVAKGIESKKYGFVLANFANGDMVGHTGKIPAAVKGLEAVDAALGKIIKACEKTKSVLVVTADHGNAEIMLEDGEINPNHTASYVPFIVFNADGVRFFRRGGCLADVAPTALDLMKIEKPKEMTGKSLLLTGGFKWRKSRKFKHGKS
ncbi:MAG: alkaline phosphatase family protein, partial [Candidatus Micrarchaeota archaeon]